MDRLIASTPGESEFHQAVGEVVRSVMPVVRDTADYRKANVLERMVVPQTVNMFRVTWVDDAGQVRVNRGYRVRMNGALGPYKGGLRFHPSVRLGLLKFLAFEQVLKNSLTTLPLGGAKGGSDFDPRGRSDGEVMRFCQAFMSELFRHIGPDVDVPAGDIGVGEREIGFLFGQYRKLADRFNGALTGKGLKWGGSQLRAEATGYGAVYFAEEMLATRGAGIKGKTAAVSGAGNLGAKAVTLSDSDGTIFDPDGISPEKIEWVKSGRHLPGEDRVGQGPEEPPTRAHPRIRRPVPPLPLHGRTAPLVRAVRPRFPQRHPERGLRRGRPPARRQRLPVRRRGRQHAHLRRRRRASRCSWTPSCCTGPARPPTRAAWRSPAWR